MPSYLITYQCEEPESKLESRKLDKRNTLLSQNLAKLHAVLSVTIHAKALAKNVPCRPGTYFGIKNFQATQHNLPKKYFFN